MLAWVFVTDLFLRARVEGLAHEVGLAVRFFAAPDALVDALDGGAVPPALVLLDLGDALGKGFAVLEAFAARTGDAPPVLAFYSHVDTATRERARALGATRVVPRSAFMTRFAELVREVTAP